MSNSPWVWPFLTRTASQENRVDQGWDLQGIPGAPILAVASGTVGKSRPDPLGFGPDYPYLVLDNIPGGAPSDTVYYGHTDVDPNMVGQHVSAGDVIGHTSLTGHNSPPGWLEIGFAQHGSGTPIQSSSGSTSAGLTIKQILNGALAGPGLPNNGFSTVPSGATATLLSAPSDCVISLPLFGCVFHKGQFRAVGGGLLLVGGVAIAGLGVWLMVGHPGSEQIGALAKVAAIA